jgi:hydrogenase-1 operon protein HyaF
MSALDSIAIVVESPPVAPDWGNALPILHEIRHGLERLVLTGEPTVIDLRAIPFGPGDEARLLQRLGRGEVEASVHALGESHIWESAIPGVWLIDHRNTEGERLALHIEIDRIPTILLAQPEDLAEAATRLESLLEGGPGAGAEAGLAPPPLAGDAAEAGIPAGMDQI